MALCVALWDESKLNVAFVIVKVLKIINLSFDKFGDWVYIISGNQSLTLCNNTKEETPIN